jgi:hypothetical protein
MLFLVKGKKDFDVMEITQHIPRALEEILNENGGIRERTFA